MTEEALKLNLVIKGRLSGLNEYTRACRNNKYAGAKLKKDNEKKVLAAILEYCQNIKIEKPVHITYKWFEQNKRRDLDNIAFSKKYIQDALVKSGVLQNDGWQHVTGFSDEFYIDKDNPRIEVEIKEVEK